MGSKHLQGLAVDFSDVDGKLKNWVLLNLELFEKIGLWMESFEATTTWLHVQSVPPKSGKRFFKP